MHIEFFECEVDGSTAQLVIDTATFLVHIKKQKAYSSLDKIIVMLLSSPTDIKVKCLPETSWGLSPVIVQLQGFADVLLWNFVATEHGRYKLSSKWKTME